MASHHQLVTTLLFVIPCYNEEVRLNVQSFLEYGDKRPNVHFLFVDDGSQDGTSQVLQALCQKLDQASFLTLTENGGKAEAIRQGVLSLTEKARDYDFIGYMDADLSVPLKEIDDFIDEIEKNDQIKFLMGIRVARLGAHIYRTKTRHYLGRIFATVVGIMLKKPVYDTQCGAKLIEGALVTELFKEAFISKWLFDIELIIRWKKAYPSYNDRIFEYPLKNWSDVAGTKLKVFDFLKAPLELFQIWKRYRQFL